MEGTQAENEGKQVWDRTGAEREEEEGGTKEGETELEIEVIIGWGTGWIKGEESMETDEAAEGKWGCTTEKEGWAKPKEEGWTREEVTEPIPGRTEWEKERERERGRPGEVGTKLKVRKK